MPRRHKVLVSLLFCLMLAGSPAFAQTTVQKHVSWNVDPLVGHAAGPFSLNFQLTDGAGTGNGNVTVTVSNAPFAGFSFNNSSFFQSNISAFTPMVGVPVEFDLTFTYTGTDAPTPDQFSFAALDSSNVELPTVGPADALATFDVTGSGIVVATYAGDAGQAPNIGFQAPVVTDIGAPVVPEPASAALLVPAAVLLFGLRRKHRNARPSA